MVLMLSYYEIRIRIKFFIVMIGRCHDQRPGLPNGVGPTDVMYGVKTIKGDVY